MQSTSAETPSALNPSSRTSRSSSRTPLMPLKALMLIRASPRNRSGYLRTSAVDSSFETPNGTDRTMPSFASLPTYASRSMSGRWSAPSRRERKIRL